MLATNQTIQNCLLVADHLPEIDYEIQHPTGFKQYLINILMQGKINADDHDWLSSSLAFKSLLSRDQVNLLDCVFDDIDAGFIQVTCD